MKILIIEDEKIIREELQELLLKNGYEVFMLTDFTNVLPIDPDKYDLILLDINLPNLNGEFLLKEIRKTSNIPIIMLTSRVDEMDEVLSITNGADDYITKPYNPIILLLRIQNIFKRINSNLNYLKYKNILFDLKSGVIKKDNLKVELTKNEMIIFNYLLTNKNKIISRDELMTILWNNDEYINDNSLTVNISRLRKKLDDLQSDVVIETRKGCGYILSWNYLSILKIN
mgnify:FL=1